MSWLVNAQMVIGSLCDDIGSPNIPLPQLPCAKGYCHMPMIKTAQIQLKSAKCCPSQRPRIDRLQSSCHICKQRGMPPSSRFSHMATVMRPVGQNFGHSTLQWLFSASWQGDSELRAFCAAP